MMIKPVIAAFALVMACVAASGPAAFAEQGTLSYYGKGVADDSSPFRGETLRTIINGDMAIVVHPGNNGIEVVRMNIVPSETCIQTQSTFCFDATVSNTKNTNIHEIGDKVGITLDLENKKQIITVNSGAMQGTTVTINLSKTIIKSDEPFIVSLTREGGFAGLPGRTITIDSEEESVSINDPATYLSDALSPDEVAMITKQVKRASLLNAESADYPPHPSSADYFTYTLEFTQGPFQRTITWTDTSAGVPKGISELMDAITEVSDDLGVAEQNQDVVEIALDFVRSSPTFAYDGMEETLSVGEIFVMESFPEQYRVEISFTSAHGGFGNREGQIVTQVLTPHVMDILISEGNVLSAVTDGQWDELNHQYVLTQP